MIRESSENVSVSKTVKNFPSHFSVQPVETFSDFFERNPEELKVFFNFHLVRHTYNKRFIHFLKHILQVDFVRSAHSSTN